MAWLLVVLRGDADARASLHARVLSSSTQHTRVPGAGSRQEEGRAELNKCTQANAHNSCLHPTRVHMCHTFSMHACHSCTSAPAGDSTPAGPAGLSSARSHALNVLYLEARDGPERMYGTCPCAGRVWCDRHQELVMS